MDPSHSPAIGPPWYVISLRPPGMHEGLRREAARSGGRVFACAPMRVLARPSAALGAALACDTVVFTSPAAARFAAAAAGGFTERGSQRRIAVGAGTAAMLRRHGAGRVDVPARMDAEGVLALPGLDALSGQRVGLVTAPGGRNVLEPALRARGGDVVRADVYRREAIAIGRDRLQRLARLPRPAVLLVSSGEALGSLMEQLPEILLGRLREDPVVASSARLAAIVTGHGFERVEVATSARPADLIAAAVHVCGRGFG